VLLARLVNPRGAATTRASTASREPRRVLTPASPSGDAGRWAARNAHTTWAVSCSDRVSANAVAVRLDEVVPPGVVTLPVPDDAAAGELGQLTLGLLWVCDFHSRFLLVVCGFRHADAGAVGPGTYPVCVIAVAAAAG
jgi:hypothetical protein